MASKATLGLSFRVNQATIRVDVPTRLNIKKRHEQVLCLTKTDNSNINLSYVSGKQVTPALNLFINDRGHSLQENRLFINKIPTVVTAKSFTIRTDKFLLTDIFTEQLSTQPATPLFYKHTLKNFNDSESTFANKTLLAVEFTDYKKRTIKTPQHKIDATTGNVYSNLISTHNDKTQNFTVYFIRYTVKEKTGDSYRTTIYYELLQSDPVYELATFDDIDDLGNIIAGRKKYIIEQLPASVLWSVTTSTGNKYAYVETDKSRISVLSPTSVNLKEPWLVQVSNGSFVTSLRVNLSEYVNFKYYIAEFTNQNFTPYPPYKLQTEQSGIYIDSTIIKAQKNIVDDPDTGFFIDIAIRDVTGTALYAFTTDESKLNTLFEGSVAYGNSIVSVSEATGFIELDTKIGSNSVIEITYYTSEDLYEFSRIDFNPLANPSVLNSRIVLYIAPESNRTGVVEKTLHYLSVDALGKITYSSQADDADTFAVVDYATQRLLDEDFDSDGKPTHEFYYDISGDNNSLYIRASGLVVVDGVDTYILTDGQTPSGIVLSEFSFIDKYTTESQLLNRSNVPSGTALQNYRDNPRFLVVADISVGQSNSIQSLSEFDVRVQGGGIVEGLNSTAMSIQPEVSWYSDIGLGVHYPTAGAFVVEVPKSIMKSHGGLYSQDDIRDIVSRHMDAGGWAVVREYGIDPVITSAIVTSGLITTYWPSYGEDVEYNLYYSKAANSDFSKINDNVILDVSSGNSYTVSGLTAATTYFMKVSATGNEEIEYFGPTVAIATSGLATI